MNDLFDYLLAMQKGTGGGGGDSDFTTCTMTVINQTGAPAVLTCPCIMGEGGVTCSPVAIIFDASAEITIVLYKGNATCIMGAFGHNYNYTFEGNYDEDTQLCTGDVTVTLLPEDISN